MRFPARAGLLANANFSYSYSQPVSRGRSACEEFTRVRVNQTQLVASRRPLPEFPATTSAGKRLYLLRHGGKEWLDEDRHSRIAVETRMGHEVAGMEGLYSRVTSANQVAAASRPAREGTGKCHLPFELEEWWKQQVRAAQNLDLNSFMKFITTKSFMPFVIYRVILGIILFVLITAGVLSPHAGESAG